MTDAFETGLAEVAPHGRSLVTFEKLLGGLGPPALRLEAQLMNVATLGQSYLSVMERALAPLRDPVLRFEADFLKVSQPACAYLTDLARALAPLQAPALRFEADLMRLAVPTESYLKGLAQVLAPCMTELRRSYSPLESALSPLRFQPKHLMPHLDGFGFPASTSSSSASLAAQLTRLLADVFPTSPLADYRKSLIAAIEQVAGSAPAGGVLHLNSADAAAGVLSWWDRKSNVQGAGVIAPNNRRLPQRLGLLSIDVSAMVRPVCMRCGKELPSGTAQLQINLATLLFDGINLEVPVFPLCECIADLDPAEPLLPDGTKPTLQLSLIQGDAAGDVLPTPRTTLRLLNRPSSEND